MASWHPPIPAEAVYSDEVAQLGAGLRLLWYLYNGVRRDGTVDLSIKQASESLSTAYDTVRNWWQLLKPLGIVGVIEDKGRNGLVLKFADDWIDWHVLVANYERSNMTVEEKGKPASTVGERSNLPDENAQRFLNGFSMGFERSNMTVDTSGNKVLIDSDQAGGSTRAKKRASPPPKHEPKKERDANLDHPAVVVYRDTFKSTPDAEMRRAIAMAVTHIELWTEVCKLWKTNRWDYLKVENLISRYQKNGHSNGKHIRQGAGPDYERAQWRSDTGDEPA